MFTKLISLGLMIIPFFIWPGFDSRQPKLFMALVLSLALGLYAFYKGYFKACKNIWLLLFIAFIPLSYILGPQINMHIAGVQAASWVLQSLLYVVVFFIAYLSISSYGFSVENKNKLLKVMMFTGLAMSLYSIIQYFGFDQFFKGPQGGYIAVCGTLGSPNILSPFLGMIIPIALYFRKYLYAVIMIIIVFITNSQVAYGAMVVSLIFLIGTKSKALRNAMLILFAVLVLILSVGYFKSTKIKSFVGDSGRFHVWSQVYNDIKNPMAETGKKYCLTGYGLGSFKYFFHTKHSIQEAGDYFLEAHNEYLELLYNTGLIGLGLFLMAMFFLFSQAFPLNRLNAHLLSSLICISVCAGGVFIWQNGATIFYTLVIAGLLGNKEEACKVD